MVIISTMIIFMFMGVILFYLTKIMPILQFFFMDWIAIIVMCIPVMICIMRLSGKSRSLKFFETIPPGKYLTIFLRRDGTAEPTYCTRPFHGESFLDAPKIGLIHDLGKGSVWRLGDKNIRFTLENVNHTPDPRYVNFSSYLYNVLGLNNKDDVMSALFAEDGKEHIEDQPEQTPVENILYEAIENDEIKEQENERKNLISFLSRRGKDGS